MPFVRRLDALGFTRFHYRLITVGGLGILFDAFDVGILGFVLAALIQAWHLAPFDEGLIASINLAGMAIGAGLAGTLADRVGRRRIFMLTLLGYSIFTGLSGLAWGIGILMVLRFLVGVGLGGELPVTTTLVSEFLPTRLRGRGIVYLETFWAVGSLVAALVAFLVIPAWGWRFAFLVGALPALYVLYLRRNIPESPRYLDRAGAPELAEAVVNTVAGAQTHLTDRRALDAVPHARADHLGELFSRRWARQTVALWVLWLGMNLAYYGIFLWFPSVLVHRGYSLVDSLGYTLIITAVQLPGYLSAGALVDRWGRRPVLVVYLILAALFAYLFGHAAGTAPILLYGSGLAFFNLGAWGVTYAYTAEQYPTLLRATGNGWAMGVGRVGGIIGPFVVGALLASHTPLGQVFVVFTIAMLVCALIVLLLGRETAGKSLEEISGETLSAPSLAADPALTDSP